MGFDKIIVPSQGKSITVENGKLIVPDNPVIPFIEGDGVGFEIWSAAVRVFDAAVEKAYEGRRKICWMEVYAGEKASSVYGTDSLLPLETLDALKKYRVAVKGPISAQVCGKTNPVNASIIQLLDLYAGVKPVRYFSSLPSPLKKPEDIRITVFKENMEDITTGIEFEVGSGAVQKIGKILEQEGFKNKLLYPDKTAFGIKPVSETGSKRIARAAIRYAIEHKLPSVTIVHKNNPMKLTDGMFTRWSYEVAKDEFSKETISWEDCGGNPPAGFILVKDVSAETFSQQVLSRPTDYSVVVTLNSYGDCITNTLSAMVGGVGIAPGANVNFDSGHGVFEATHCAATKYAGLNKVNPLSLILSGVMMFQYLGWEEAANILTGAIEKVIHQKTVTYDFARLMDGAKEVMCSEFADVLIKNM